eukprot:1393685-Amorphochlora_amoeboformis.AAC.1
MKTPSHALNHSKSQEEVQELTRRGTGTHMGKRYRIHMGERLWKSHGKEPQEVTTCERSTGSHM